MNASKRQRQALIDEQAASWAARLDGGILEAADRAALDAWLMESPHHRAALSEYCQLSADLEERLPELVARGTLEMPRETRPSPARRFPKLVSLGLAAAAAVAVGTWALRPVPQVQNVATAVAQRHTETLADGTRVHLNAHTSLRFENSKSERRVRLAGGEALFIVAEDQRRPFVVETPSGSVRVTGTTFNVRNEGGDPAFEVTVVEGSVQVRPSTAPDGGAFSLTAGEQLTVSPGGVAVRLLSGGAIEDTLAWREGAIVFEGVPLRDVAARLARHHGRRIVVAPAIAEERVGGRFGLDDFGAFLAALEVALPVKVGYDLSGAVSIVPRTGS